MSKAIIIKVDGTKEPLDDLSLAAMQEAVGGYIQIIKFNTPWKGWDMAIINEEGKLHNMPFNHKATLVLSTVAGHYLGIGDTRGDVVFTKEEYFND